MNYQQGNIIDEKFEVEGLCSDTGGMGDILFVKDLISQSDTKLVLKYCKEDDENYIKRFKREVRLTNIFKDNSRIVNILHSNTEYEPPYFIMEYYENGDLTNIVDELKINLEVQEKIFKEMIDCIQELHNQNIYHRDIKPQNFLLKQDLEIVVSDFGLGVEPNSTSRCTSTNMFGGTEGYLPPEFSEGGFKYADAKGDIFMLGKSFYALLTKKDPNHMQMNGINPLIYSIIEKACTVNKDNRYNNLDEMKQAVKMAYDIIIGRSQSPYTETINLLKDINDKLETSGRYDNKTVTKFLQKLPLNKPDEQGTICQELQTSFFEVLTENGISSYLETFLKMYEAMIEKADYSFSFAESIAKNMQAIFNGEVSNEIKCTALDLAIRGAYITNRFSAMDTCTDMIHSIDDDNLGMYISAVIIKNKDTFIENIEPSDCKCSSIVNTISAIKD